MATRGDVLLEWARVCRLFHKLEVYCEKWNEKTPAAVKDATVKDKQKQINRRWYKGLRPFLKAANSYYGKQLTATSDSENMKLTWGAVLIATFYMRDPLRIDEPNG